MKWGLRAPSPAGCSSLMKGKLWKAAHQMRSSKIQKKIAPSYSFLRSFHIKTKRVGLSPTLFSYLKTLCIELPSHFTVYPDRVMPCGESTKIQIRLKRF